MILTMKFVEDLICYLNECFKSDTRFSVGRKITGCMSYDDEFIENAKLSFFTIDVLNRAPDDETFNNIITLAFSIQIDIFALKGGFANKGYDAKEMALILQDTISNYMQKLKFENKNPNICLLREMGGSPALPFKDGSRAFTSSLRYDITIMKEYETKK